MLYIKECKRNYRSANVWNYCTLKCLHIDLVFFYSGLLLPPSNNSNKKLAKGTPILLNQSDCIVLVYPNNLVKRKNKYLSSNTNLEESNHTRDTKTKESVSY